MKAIIVALLVIAFAALASPLDRHEAVAAPAPGGPLAMFQQCSTARPGTSRVTFIWAPADQGPQWLDLTTGDPDFPAGTYVSAGPLASGTWGFVWDGIAPNAVHAVRVNALTAGGWAPSAPTLFLTSACDRSQAAIAFEVRGACEAGVPVGTFVWAPSSPRGLVQWLDLSVYDNGFAPGTFISAGPLTGDTSTYVWAGLTSGLPHVWRINTWDGSAWRASNTKTVFPRCSAPAAGSPPSGHTPGCSTEWGPIASAQLARLSHPDGICVNNNSALPNPECIYGCYYPDQREIFLPAGGPPRDDEYTLTHEICHTHQHFLVLPSGAIAQWTATAEGEAFIAAVAAAQADAAAGLTLPVPNFGADPVEGFGHAYALWYVEGKIRGRTPLSTWPALERFAKTWLPR